LQNSFFSNCTISYTVSYRGYGNPNTTRIEEYIAERTREYASPPMVKNTASNQNKICFNSICLYSLLFTDKYCSNGLKYRQQDVCYYCGTESPCAELPESKCALPETNTIGYFCQ